MTVVPLEFSLQSNPGRYVTDQGGRLINAYAEQSDGKGRAQFPLFCIEGLANLSTLSGGGRTRGAISLSPYGYVVSGPLLFKVSPGGSATALGGFPGSGPAFMARNRKTNPQIAIVCDGLRYLCEADVLTSIADTDLPAANSVTSIAGYFVWSIADGRYFISDIDEGTTVDALDFAEAEANPDGLLVAYARGREIALFGNSSIEFHAHTGAATFPFEDQPGSTIQNLGLLCRHSVKDLNDVVHFVASDGTVRLLDGYQPVRISTHDVEKSIDRVADKDSITATAYAIRGHQFYNLSCPDWTWTFDGLTRLWHERQSYGEDRWRGEVFVDINGERVIGDFENGVLYQLDPDTYTEAGTHLVWKVVSAPAHAYPNRLLINRLFLDTIPGVGLNTANAHNSDPKVMVRVSKDGGNSWSNERQASVGAIGDKSHRVSMNRFGMTKQAGALFEISMSAAVIKGLTSAAIDVEPLSP